MVLKLYSTLAPIYFFSYYEAYMQGLGSTEVIIILVILIFIFGSNKIVDLARGAGEATKELKNIKKDFKKTVDEITDKEPADKTKPQKGGDTHT